MNKILLITFSTLLILFQIPSIAQLPSYVPANELVGWWSFSGNANDSSGNLKNGIVTGATLTTDRFGNSNSAYSFNNISDNISINNLHQTNILKYSISGWFQKSSNSINKEGTIISGSNPCNAPGGLRYHIGSTNQAVWGTEFQECSSMWSITKNKNYADNSWHHFVATFDGSIGLITWNNFKIYIDDSLVSQMEYSQGNLNNLIAPINNQNLPTIIGNTIGIDDGFQGKLDDIGIWNRVLTKKEINHLYNSTSGYVGINILEPLRNLHINDVLRIEPRPTEPNNPAKGDIYFDGIINKLRVFDGTAWQNCW